MDIEYIIVQAGGKGTRMESLTRNKPKALVPVDNLPMLFHLFRMFPNKKFVVIGDYKYDVLRQYLEAFAEVDYQLIRGTGAYGTCAGIPAALDCVPENTPFMLIWSDLVLPASFKFPENDGNYIGVAKDFPCRWKFEHGEFCEERSEEFGVAGLFLFQNKSVLEQVPAEGEFVRWLKESSFPKKEFALYRAKEYGLISEYHKQMPSKRCRPFNKITVDGDTVVKEGIDDQGKELAARECDWYQRAMRGNFQQIPKIYSLHPLRMERIDGEPVHTYAALTLEQKKTILFEIIDCLKRIQSLGEIPADADSYYEAYVGKTFERLKKVRELVPFAQDEAVLINGKRCRNIFFHRSEVEKLAAAYVPDKFRFIHGDCTFSNILLRSDGMPVLIDPRGYFGHTQFYGDPAYDWAKLYYSIVGNYDQFNLKRFQLDILDREVSLHIESSHWEDMEEYFFSQLPGEITPRQIKLFHAIIWLSLTTYAWEDYDSICGAYYNGLFYLEDVL